MRPSIATTGGIRGGDITIRGENINITQGSTEIVPFNNNIDTIDADSLSNLPGGTIAIEGKQINLTENVRITSESWNFSGDFNSSNLDRSEGNIFIGASTDNDDIAISSKASIVTDTYGFHDNNDLPADAGNITIGNINSESVSIEGGSEIAAESHSHNQMTGGIRTDFDSGDAGSITVRGQRVTITGEETNITATAFGTGKGGNIIIDGTRFVRILDRANVVAETAGAAETATAGDISIGHNHANNEITVNNATVSVRAGETIAISHGNDPELGLADAGDISIGSSSSEINLLNNAEVSVSSQLGSGSPGNLFIESNFLTLDNALLLARTPSGNEGNINLQIARTFRLSNGSRISAQASGAGDGGNIIIDAEFIVAFVNQNNDIVANARGGMGGNIDIIAKAIFGLEERNSTPPNMTNDIDASSEFGLNGNVSIFTPDVASLETTSELPADVIQPEQTVAQACQSDRLAENSSSLTILGKGGVSQQPTEPLNPDAIIVDGQTISPSLQSQYPDIKPIKTQYGDIIPARGVIKTEDGRVILTAYPTDNLDPRIANNFPNCIRS